jgi:hypothetical protein
MAAPVGPPGSASPLLYAALGGLLFVVTVLGLLLCSWVVTHLLPYSSLTIFATSLGLLLFTGALLVWLVTTRFERSGLQNTPDKLLFGGLMIFLILLVGALLGTATRLVTGAFF